MGCTVARTVEMDMAMALLLFFGILVSGAEFDDYNSGVSPPFSIRHGTDHDKLNKSYPLLSLSEVLGRVRQSQEQPLNGYVVNCGAADRDVDPIYALKLGSEFPAGYTILGYECELTAAQHLAKKRPDVTVRHMCINRTSIIADMKQQGAPKEFAILKTDIDSIDAVILDAILGHGYRPLVIYSEIMWDFPPPIDFAVIENARPDQGCFGMSLSMVQRILKKHGYTLVEAAHANVMAVQDRDAHLFVDRPHDEWYWFSLVKSAKGHTHWKKAPGKQHSPATVHKGDPPIVDLAFSGLFSPVNPFYVGGDNFVKPPVPVRTIDKTMHAVAAAVARGCGVHNSTYLLAVGDRCCAPQWGHLPRCICSFAGT